MAKFKPVPLVRALVMAAAFIWPVPAGAGVATRKYDGEIQRAVKRWWPDVPYWMLWKAQLLQESRLDPAAVSPAGARGLAQFMPATYAEVARELRLTEGPHGEQSIEAGAYYMMKLRRVWKAERTALQKHTLAQGSYNAGTGSILKAQARCAGARLWPEIAPCLASVTGPKNAHETITYIARIATIWKQLEVQ